VEEGIFWRSELEGLVPPGYSDKQVDSWMEKARTSQVVALEKGCGRISNRLATFTDGTKACIRYGINSDQILGETLSFYLSRLLGIRNVPPLALSELNSNNDQWFGVRKEVDSSQWTDKAVVSFTQWISNLTDVVTPAPLRAEDRKLHPLRAELENRSLDELVEFIQWTDLILFDYLTANFDRLVSNLFSQQWDSRSMERATSNLQKASNGSLVFLDNEAGLVHGYRVLEMWDKYHATLLNTVCVFRRRTAQKIIELHRLQNTAEELLRLYQTSEPLSSGLGFLSEEHSQLLQSRVDLLYKHILHCKATYKQKRQGI
uniref:Four-jointed box kinase 1 n=1 Tax=Latimeria chalumnae TaxID=7897 RepID=H3AYL0_LATCH